MDPNEILRLLRSAKKLVNDSGSSPEAFIISYVAWEAFQNRIFLVGLCARGKSVVEAKRIVIDRQIWQLDRKKELFRDVFGSYPENSRFVGKYFREASKLKKLRDSYIHGAKRVQPDKYREGAELLISIIESDDWSVALGDLLSRQGTPSRVTNPLARLTRNRTIDLNSLK